MKNKDLFVLLEAIKNIGNNTDIKFAYNLAKNMKLIIAELEIFQDLLKPSENFIIYDAARVELCKKHAEKDKKGKPKIVNDEYVFASREEFDKEVLKLKVSHKKALEERDKRVKEYNEMMDEDSNFKPHKIRMEDVPKDISVVELNGIFELIVAPEEKK